MENIYAYENEIYRKAKVPQNVQLNPLYAIFDVCKTVITLLLMSVAEIFVNIWCWIKNRGKLENIEGKIALVTGSQSKLNRLHLIYS